MEDDLLDGDVFVSGQVCLARDGEEHVHLPLGLVLGSELLRRDLLHNVGWDLTWLIRHA